MKAVGKAAKSPNNLRDFKVPIILTTEEDESYSAIGLLDSGCTDSAINRRLVKELNLLTKQFLVPRQSYNADLSKNRAGHVTEYTTLRLDIQGHPDMRHFVILDLGKTDVFIGLDWISHHNPEIDWVSQTINFSRCPPLCSRSSDLPSIHFHQLFLRGVSMDLAREAAAKKPQLTLDEQLPKWLKDFKDVFEPKSFDQLPPFKPGFDHAINLKPDAPKVSPFKIYPLSPSQKIAMKEFVEEHLKTG
jgi:Retroviral aspartyl protease